MSEEMMSTAAQTAPVSTPASAAPAPAASAPVAPAGATGAKKSDFWVTNGSATVALPAPASQRLRWTHDGEHIDYVATAAHADVRSDTGRLSAQMFYLSYVSVDSDGKADPSRPVTFLFNGGPGSASVPINFGGMGPLRVQTDGTKHLPANSPVTDNPHTLLKYSDLVFFDAPGTGFSPVAADADPKEIFGIDGDADAFCRAITDWLEKEGRWSSPLYLFGESYGTVRNAVLMRLLGERGIKLTGVTMLSAIWDWVQTLPGEDLYYLGMLPTFAATAQFFGRAGNDVDVDAWFDKALQFSDEVYAPALLVGDRLGEAREREVAEQISALIGLPANYIASRHLRISLEDFRGRLLADEAKVCGRLDTRFVSDAPSYQQLPDWLAEEDAADDAVNAVWTTAFRSFLRDRLGYSSPARYLDNNYGRIGTKWNWEHEAPGTGEKVGAPNVALDIACALRRDPTIKMCVIGGRYDAATTYWNVIHDLSAQFLSDEIKERVEFHLYGCGHMAYVDVPTLEAMDKDLAAFYHKA